MVLVVEVVLVVPNGFRWSRCILVCAGGPGGPGGLEAVCVTESLLLCLSGGSSDSQPLCCVVQLLLCRRRRRRDGGDTQDQSGADSAQPEPQNPGISLRHE